jgi:hypothetical protein
MSAKDTTTLYTALLAAQRAMGPVKKDASNPAFRSKYASLQSILDTIEQPLWDNGLVLVQRFEPSVNRDPVLITEIIHAASGERITSALDVVGKDRTDPQKVGSAITYARRYSLLALLGLTPEEDDDGNAAAKPAPRPQERPAPAPPAAPVANGQPALALADADDVIAKAKDLARSEYKVAEVYKFVTDQQAALGDDWPRVLKAWREDIKPLIGAATATAR